MGLTPSLTAREKKPNGTIEHQRRHDDRAATCPHLCSTQTLPQRCLCTPPSFLPRTRCPARAAPGGNPPDPLLAPGQLALRQFVPHALAQAPSHADLAPLASATAADPEAPDAGPHHSSARERGCSRNSGCTRHGMRRLPLWCPRPQRPHARCLSTHTKVPCAPRNLSPLIFRSAPSRTAGSERR